MDQQSHAQSHPTPLPTAESGIPVVGAGSAAEIPGWEEASACPGGFYLSPGWLASADGDRVSTPWYVRAGDVFLAAHYSPEENNPYYQPGLILGGRRGYLSPLLTTHRERRPAQKELQTAVAQACQHFDTATYTWPYLSSTDAQGARSALGGDIFFAGAHCVIDCDAHTDHISSLPSKQRRTNARRELRRFTEAGLRVRRLRLGQSPATPENLGPLLGQVQRSYGHDHSDDILIDLLRRQREELGDASVVFLAEEADASDTHAPGTLRGFSLCYTHGDSLYVRLVGFDRQHTADTGIYGVLAIFEPVAYAQTQGLRQVFLGMESFEAKVRRGARVEPLWTLVSAGATARTVDPQHILDQLPPREAEEFAAALAAMQTHRTTMAQ